MNYDYNSYEEFILVKNEFPRIYYESRMVTY